MENFIVGKNNMNRDNLNVCNILQLFFSVFFVKLNLIIMVGLGGSVSVGIFYP